MKSKNPIIEWQQKNKVDCLRFTFEEKLTEQDAVVAIKEWKAAFDSKPGKQIVIIWDCRQMKVYESGARKKWTTAIKQMKPQISKIWLITNSSIIKMGASLMGMATALNIKAVSTEKEMDI